MKNWVYFSLTPAFLKHLVGKNIATEYWNVLKKAFANGSSARLKQLRWQLQTIRKGMRSMENYINYCRDLINHLIAVGDTISEKEQIMYVIGDLDANYNSLIITVSDKDKENFTW